jgi:hypothetical protein
MQDDTEKLPPWPEGDVVDIPISDGSKSRKQGSWRSTPQREFLRCLTAALYKERRLSGKALSNAFKALVPDYERHLPGVTPKVIATKGYNCSFYEKENPDKDPKALPYYELSKQVVARCRQGGCRRGAEVPRHLAAATA